MDGWKNKSLLLRYFCLLPVGNPYSRTKEDLETDVRASSHFPKRITRKWDFCFENVRRGRERQNSKQQTWFELSGGKQVLATARSSLAKLSSNNKNKNFFLFFFAPAKLYFQCDQIVLFIMPPRVCAFWKLQLQQRLFFTVEILNEPREQKGGQ